MEDKNLHDEEEVLVTTESSSDDMDISDGISSDTRDATVGTDDDRPLFGPVKARDTTIDTSGNYMNNKSFFRPKKARDATSDINGNFIKNRPFLKPKKVSDFSMDVGSSSSFSDESTGGLTGIGGSLLSDNETAKGTVSLALKKVPLKVKLIIIGVIAVIIFLILFLIVMITPLMSLGIIDIDGIGGGSSSSSISYSSVTDGTTYWWPIGSNDITTSNGVDYASGTPVETTITSTFSTRDNPFSSGTEMHGGLDIASNDGSYGINIIAAKDGKVIYPSDADTLNCTSNNSSDSCGGGYGNYVMIEHSDGTVTLYAHLYEGSITVRTGDTVKQGQVIGKMGSSGRSTGAHLHFEVRINGSRVNPENYVKGSNPRPKIASYGYINGESNKQSVCLTLKYIGIPDNGVAAIMTNINYESSFDPTVHGDLENGEYTSYGLCQWHNGRYDNLRKAFPDTYNTIGSQIDYLMYELKNSYTSVYDAVMNSSESVYDSTYTFCANFERPADTENSCKRRANNSDSYATYVSNGCQ